MVKTLASNLVAGTKEFLSALPEAKLKVGDSDDVKASVDYFQNTASVISDFDTELVKHGKTLWNDKDFRASWDKREKLDLSFINIEYILSNLERLSAKEAIASDEDALRTRVRTTGQEKVAFQFRGHNFEVTDLGGQRSERRNWARAVPHPTAVVFFGALSDFNVKSLTAEPVKSKLDETIEIWEEVLQIEEFNNSIFILMLNKFDLLTEKLKVKPFNHYYPKYTGKNEPDDVAEFILARFKRRFPDNRPESALQYHFTCALDSKQMKKVFESIQTAVVELTLGSL